MKESVDITNEEISYIQHASNTLEYTEVTLNGNFHSVTHAMLLSMIDGNICNSAFETKSTVHCFVSGDTSKDFKDLGLTKEIREGTLKLGLPIRHVRIRKFKTFCISLINCTLKMAVQSKEEKDLATAKKGRILECLSQNGINCGHSESGI